MHKNATENRWLLLLILKEKSSKITFVFKTLKRDTVGLRHFENKHECIKIMLHQAILVIPVQSFGSFICPQPCASGFTAPSF
jgi:5-formaminoimidazole-4-carboxamide-1-beta-D-ribofuranosyl 5'-monophosphate synthetase